MVLLQMTCCVHGTLVYLPKDRDGALCDSDNYRGICLCSCITKVYESVFVSRYSKQLETSNLQYSFKGGHSTTTCCMTLKEVATGTYYMNRDPAFMLVLLMHQRPSIGLGMISFLNYYLDVEFRM